MSGHGLVYLLRSGDTKRYKIGRTINSVAKRVRHGLATGNPDPLHEIAFWELPVRHGDFEALLHAEFYKYRMRAQEATEFFDFKDMLEADIIASIQQLYDTFLDDLTFDYEPEEQATDECRVLNSTAEALLNRRIALSAEIRKREIEMESIDIRLKQIVGPSAGLCKDNGSIVLTLKTITSQRMDQAAFKKDYPDLVTRYATPHKYRSLRIL